jgi:hypothetical protein
LTQKTLLWIVSKYWKEKTSNTSMIYIYRRNTAYVFNDIHFQILKVRVILFLKIFQVIQYKFNSQILYITFIYNFILTNSYPIPVPIYWKNLFLVLVKTFRIWFNSKCLTRAQVLNTFKNKYMNLCHINKNRRISYL